MNDSMNGKISNIHEKDIQLLTGICSLEEGIGEILRRLENKDYYLPIRWNQGGRNLFIVNPWIKQFFSFDGSINFFSRKIGHLVDELCRYISWTKLTKYIS